MDICFVPSLQHLVSTKIVASLFNKTLNDPSVFNLWFQIQLRGFQSVEYKRFKEQVFRDIGKLTESPKLQNQLKTFFTPLFCEFEQLLMNCSDILEINDKTLIVIAYSIPHCWFTDGTVDVEKLMKSVVKNNGIHLLNRFALACTYCLCEDILNLWELLPEIEIAQILETTNTNYFITSWVRWLKGISRSSSLTWNLRTCMWKDNMYETKRILLSSGGRILMKHISRVSGCDYMRFVLSVMTKEERELIFKKFPVEVFQCFASWPLRRSFFDLADNFWTYVSDDTFCSILEWLLMQIETQWDPEDCLEILKYLWSKSTPDFQNAAKADFRFSEQLQLVLESDFKQDLLNSESFKCFRLRQLI